LRQLLLNVPEFQFWMAGTHRLQAGGLLREVGRHVCRPPDADAQQAGRADGAGPAGRQKGVYDELIDAVQAIREGDDPVPRPAEALAAASLGDVGCFDVVAGDKLVGEGGDVHADVVPGVKTRQRVLHRRAQDSLPGGAPYGAARRLFQAVIPPSGAASFPTLT